MIVYGYKKMSAVMGRVQQACPKCQQVAPQTVVRVRTWMTLFWVKVFPIKKKTFMRCNACGNQVQIDNAQADAWFTKAPAGAPGAPQQR